MTSKRPRWSPARQKLRGSNGSDLVGASSIPDSVAAGGKLGRGLVYLDVR